MDTTYTSFNVSLLPHEQNLRGVNSDLLFFHRVDDYSFMYSGGISLVIDRKDILGSAMQQIGGRSGHSLRQSSFSVAFKDEPGLIMVLDVVQNFLCSL